MSGRSLPISLLLVLQRAVSLSQQLLFLPLYRHSNVNVSIVHVVRVWCDRPSNHFSMSLSESGQSAVQVPLSI